MIDKGTLATFLFISGLVLEGIGFYFSNLDQYPELKRMVSGNTIQAKKQIKEIENPMYFVNFRGGQNHYLKVLYLDFIESYGIDIKRSDITVKEFRLGHFYNNTQTEDWNIEYNGVILTFSPPLPARLDGSSPFNIGIDLPSRGEPIYGQKVKLQDFLEFIDKREASNIHKFTVWIFMFGIFLQVIGFFIDKKNSAAKLSQQS